MAGTRRIESYDGNGKRYRHVEEANDRGDETHEAIALVSAGALRRLSSAVFIDRARGLDLVKVRALSSAALGYDVLRGDTLTVEAVDFRHELPARRNPWWLLYGAVVPILPALVLAVGFVAGVKLGLPAAAAVLQTLVDRAMVERTTKTAAGFPRHASAACWSKSRRMPPQRSSAHYRQQPQRRS